jgi:hypothetical protein
MLPIAPGAPAATVSPRIAIESPRPSYDALSDAVNLAVSVVLFQLLTGLTKTYAAPWSEFPLTVVNGEPATIVLPLMPTD